MLFCSTFTPTFWVLLMWHFSASTWESGDTIFDKGQTFLIFSLPTGKLLIWCFRRPRTLHSTSCPNYLSRAYSHSTSLQWEMIVKQIVEKYLQFLWHCTDFPAEASLNNLTIHPVYFHYSFTIFTIQDPEQYFNIMCENYSIRWHLCYIIIIILSFTWKAWVKPRE